MEEEKKTVTKKKTTAANTSPATKKAPAKTKSDAEMAKDETHVKKPKSTADEAATRKIIFSLCYVFGILFFLPLILYKNDPEANRHANQGLVLLILSVVGNAVFGLLTRVASIFGIVAVIYSVLLFVLGIIGIVYVVTDSKKSLPLIGSIKIIK